MKNTLLIGFLLFFSSVLIAQNTKENEHTRYRIGKPSGQDYAYIKFPKRNFTLKRGGLPNYKNLVGTEVYIVKTAKENNKEVVTIKRKDGMKFFGIYPKVKVDLRQAVESGELIPVQ